MMKTAEDRFWALVGDRSSAEACWLFEGAQSEKGYGLFNVVSTWKSATHKRLVMYAHRYSYELVNGPIPDSNVDKTGTMSVCHTCDVRLCVNPAHLWLGTNKDNTLDMVGKGRNGWSDGTLTEGELNWNHKLTDINVVNIRRRLRGGEKGRDLAREFGVVESAISQAKNGVTWNHINHLEPALEPWQRIPGKQRREIKNDLTGKTLGYFSVLERVLIDNKLFYRCSCICGKERIVAGSNLQSGNSKSCGCIRKPWGSSKS